MDAKNILTKTNYLTFTLNNELFAVEAVSVVEITELLTYTVVPNSPDHIKGILNFRGEIVPIVNMHNRFKMDASISETKMVIIVNILYENTKVLLGLLVDEVHNVLEFELKDIQNVPEFGFNYNVSFLTGMVQLDETFYLIINANMALSIKELSEHKV